MKHMNKTGLAFAFSLFGALMLHQTAVAQTASVSEGITVNKARVVTKASLEERSFDFQEGVHYRNVTTPVKKVVGDENQEVLELFWYGCPHCYALEPKLQSWLKNKPEDSVYVALPAVMGGSWETGARAYYTAEILGIVDKTHDAFFNAIHKDKRPMRKQGDVAKFFAEYGVGDDEFNKTWKSFAMETKLRRDKQQVLKYGADSVPAFVVNGQYLTSVSMAGSEDKLFEVIDYLTDMGRVAE